MSRVNANTKRKKRQAKTNAAGRELIEAVRQAYRAVTTGDFTGIAVREVDQQKGGLGGHAA